MIPPAQICTQCLLRQTCDELRYILDSKNVRAKITHQKPSVSLKKEIKEYGKYRTQRLVLGAFDALAEVERRDRRRVVNG
jgi:hypothetical protein